MSGYGYDTVQYVGKHDPAALAREIDVYKSRGISRASLFDGPPGSGKTSMFRAYLRHVGARGIIVPPSFLASGRRHELMALLSVLLPDAVLFDDIDRARDGLTFALTLIDDFRRLYPQITVISTSNNIDSRENAALLRPGRLGVRVQFDAPSLEDKGAVLDLYMRVYGVDTSKLDLPALLQEMDHKAFTHDYVRFIAEEALVASQAGLLVQIRNCVRLLNLVGGY